jgi:hypothetical protein
MKNLKVLSNADLFLKARDDVKNETAATLELLHTLREIERRRAFADKSFPSLFDFCVDFLGYKRGAAYRRILAMRALKDLPEIEAKIQDGSLNLMTLAQAQGFFKQQAREAVPLKIEEKRNILRNLEHKSVRETEKFFVDKQPISRPKENLKPVDSENYLLTATMPVRMKEKLDKLRALLGPEGNNLENMLILEKSLDIAINNLKVPALGKMKTLWLRDKSQCTFVEQGSGLRCPQKTHLEVDHIQPRALGGDSSLENLRLLCKAHNQRAAIRVFGLRRMEKFISLSGRTL